MPFPIVNYETALNTLLNTMIKNYKNTFLVFCI